MNWYYAINGQRLGPVAKAEIDKLASAGTITNETLVWCEGMAEWKPFGQVKGGAAAADNADTEVCAVSGKRYPRREMIQYEGKWISAEHRDGYFQRLREGVAQPSDGIVPGPYGYGGFWRRFLARLVDSIVLMVANGVIAGIAGAIFLTGSISPSGLVMFQIFSNAFGLALGISYEVFFVRTYDATPGKMALGLKMLRPDGAKLSVGRIIGRYFAHIVSSIILLIGYIMAAFDDEKRALHDRMCDTRVIKTR